VATRSNGVYKSLDGGASWFAINAGIDDLRTRVIKIDSIDPSILYVGGMGGLYKTIDGGASWIARDTGMPEGSFVRTLAIDPTNSQVIYAGVILDGVYRSVNGGATWEPWSTGLNLDVTDLAIDPQDTSIIYAATASGVFKTVVCYEPDQLHIVGPVPNQVPVGEEGTITATVQANSVGVSSQDVVFSRLLGNFTFTSGTVSLDGTRATVFTDNNGLTNMTFVADAAGPALIKVTVTGTKLSAFSFFFATL
jgi:hypothetical protein